MLQASVLLGRHVANSGPSSGFGATEQRGMADPRNRTRTICCSMPVVTRLKEEVEELLLTLVSVVNLLLHIYRQRLTNKDLYMLKCM